MSGSTQSSDWVNLKMNHLTFIFLNFPSNINFINTDGPSVFLLMFNLELGLFNIKVFSVGRRDLGRKMSLENKIWVCFQLTHFPLEQISGTILGNLSSKLFSVSSWQFQILFPIDHKPSYVRSPQWELLLIFSPAAIRFFSSGTNMFIWSSHFICGNYICKFLLENVWHFSILISPVLNIFTKYSPHEKLLFCKVIFINKFSTHLSKCLPKQLPPVVAGISAIWSGMPKCQ